MSTEFNKFLITDKGSNLDVGTQCSSNDVILTGRLKYDDGTLVQLSHSDIYNTSKPISLPQSGVDGTLRIVARFNGVPTRVDVELTGVCQSNPVSLNEKLTGDDGDTQMGVVDLYID